MKVIFLDIDGVLNCKYTKESFGIFIGIDPIKVELLSQLVKNTDAKLVLSSSWRLSGEDCIEYINNNLKAFGLELFDFTPYHHTAYRGLEIQEWFKNNKDLDIESFIIFDDDNDLKPYGRRHVQTSWFKGLKQKHIDKAIEMLNEECKPWFDEDIEQKLYTRAINSHRQM